jgi:hypothetical protein
MAAQTSILEETVPGTDLKIDHPKILLKAWKYLRKNR